MEYEEAKLLLLLHGPGIVDAAGKPLMLEDGFVGSLRPYAGLHEKNFHLVIEALLTVGERVHRIPQLDRDLAYAAWTICHTARSWGLEPDGMLQRNRLITAADTARLRRWVETLENVALCMLAGSPPHHAVYHYAEYVVAEGSWNNVPFFVDLMGRAVSDAGMHDSIEMITRALGTLGEAARPALPALRQAAERSYTWYTPAEQCTADTQAQIRQAIQAIEEAASEQ